jgi:eukaryotic-like serine/threonine-protein kinase
MTATSSTSESSFPELLQQFEQELLETPDPQAVFERYRMLHPALAERFRELLEAIEMLRVALFPQAPEAGSSKGDGNSPERFGPYRVVRSIGRGGMGEVYEAVEEPLGRRVAVKTIRRSQTTSASLLLRFDRERRTLARLHHTNIVPIFATGCEQDLLYFAMPYLSGASLGQVIKTARSHHGASRYRRPRDLLSPYSRDRPQTGEAGDRNRSAPS